MLCKYIYNTRTDTAGLSLCRVELVADTTPPALPIDGAGVDGLDDAARIDTGSKLSVLDTGDAYGMGADGAWHKLQNAAARGVLEIDAPGTYDVSGVALVVVKGGATA